jgi:hypothetical protein
MWCGAQVGSTGLVGGQIVDLEMEGRSEEASLETLQYIHAKKTADLLDAAVVCGAMLGGAGEEDIKHLTKYSQNIGLAFQVRLFPPPVCRVRRLEIHEGQGRGGFGYGFTVQAYPYC